MTDNAIVAIYDTPAHAELAAQDLKAAGVAHSDITLHSAADREAGGATAETRHDQGFWANLFGGEPEHSTQVYEHSVASGSTVVTVKVPDAHADTVIAILESHHPVDIEERAAGHLPASKAYDAGRAGLQDNAAPAGLRGAAGPARDNRLDTPRGEAAMQLAKEELSIGKRVVNRGGTRIRRYVVETPVEEQVTLRDEKVRVERRPVSDGRAVGADGFADRTIEMNETTEEVVVNKTARVVEEIALRREGADRVETVRDTVRRDEVEVAPLTGAAHDQAARRTTPN